MARMLVVFLVLLVFCLAESEAVMRGRFGYGKLDCGRQCAMRCSRHSRPNLCHRACGTCCARCKCVPPGTSGNRSVCGTCYATMKTHGGRLKCP